MSFLLLRGKMDLSGRRNFLSSNFSSLGFVRRDFYCSQDDRLWIKGAAVGKNGKMKNSDAETMRAAMRLCLNIDQLLLRLLFLHLNKPPGEHVTLGDQNRTRRLLLVKNRDRNSQKKTFFLLRHNKSKVSTLHNVVVGQTLNIAAI